MHIPLPKILHYFIWIIISFIVLGLGLIGASYLLVELKTQELIFNRIENLPHNRVGLVLGTSRRMADGRVNLYFKYRIEAAVALYKAGKVDYLLLSGDNKLSYYNEPLDMKKALLKAGIPEKALILDYAGFRTLDSVVRGKKVFGQQKMTIISQSFHNKRATYIARNYGIEAVGYNAQDVVGNEGLKTQIREVFARVKVVLDLFLLNTQPKFLGKPIQIGR